MLALVLPKIGWHPVAAGARCHETLSVMSKSIPLSVVLTSRSTGCEFLNVVLTLFSSVQSGSIFTRTWRIASEWDLESVEVGVDASGT